MSEAKPKETDVQDAQADTTNAVAESNTAIVKQAEAAQAQFDLTTLPPEQQLEIVRDILESEAQIEAMALPQFTSTEIVGRPVNILDASFRPIPDDKAPGGTKMCVSFVMEFGAGDAEEGAQFTCLKGSNPFNDVYVTRFERMRGVISKPLNGYEFVSDPRYNKAGNDAIVLRKISGAVMAANSRTK